MKKYTKKERYQKLLDPSMDQEVEIVPLLCFESGDYVVLDGQMQREKWILSHCKIWGGMPEVYLLASYRVRRFLEIQERLRWLSLSINRTHEEFLLIDNEKEVLDSEIWYLLNEAFNVLEDQGRSSETLKKQAIARYWQLRGY